jgi:hypothetical protein
MWTESTSAVGWPAPLNTPSKLTAVLQTGNLLNTYANIVSHEFGTPLSADEQPTGIPIQKTQYRKQRSGIRTSNSTVQAVNYYDVEAEWQL